MNKHSAGPWIFDGLTIMDRDRRVIAELAHDQSGRGVGAHEIVPNGRVLSAAWDAIEAIKAVLDRDRYVNKIHPEIEAELRAVLDRAGVL
jgi:hypothetical protein